MNARNEEGQTAEEKIEAEGDYPLVAAYLRRRKTGISNGAAQQNGADALTHPPPLPDGIKVNVGSMSADDVPVAPWEADTMLREWLLSEGLITAGNMRDTWQLAPASALLARSTQVVHSDLAARTAPFNRAFQDSAAGRMLDPATAKGAAMLDALVNQQAQIIAYIDVFMAMLIITAPSVLLLLLMRRPAASAAAPSDHAAVMD